MKHNLPEGAYNFKDIETEILDFWLNNELYKPEFNPKINKLVSTEEMLSDKRESWSLICPPPNAYGRPHIGNISGYAYQDAMARFQRMKGKKVLVLPGKDHAGLEGEGVFVRDVLEKKGIYKFDLEREEFYKMIWDFNMENREKALNDEKRIGLSADFSRDKFTLDDSIIKTVLSTFVEMYKEKMIYKGVRIVNWDPKARTVVADNQCIREERDGSIFYIKYFLAEGKTFKYRLNNESEEYEERNYIIVATTRPETMFGDTAVAVNSTDYRYKDLIGKKLIIPLINISIPVITSERVLLDFGSGCLKITPAHSHDDSMVMNEWNLKNPDDEIHFRNVINKDLKMCGTVPEKFRDRKYKEILPELIEDLRNLNILVKEEKIKQNILKAERTGALIEPLMSSQWFISVEKLKQPVIEMVTSGKVKIHPENMEKKFFFWMENLRDWAISRSLWWGYRMPVWYSGEVSEEVQNDGSIKSFITINGYKQELDPSNNEQIRVQIEKPDGNWIQDENVLDTWFSSGQWPYATLMSENLMEEFYPTSVMETGFDILENWVSRMMMFSWFKFKEVPFRDVYLHGLVLGKDGQKMSKSKGNLVDIDSTMQNYGTDALRMVYFYQNRAGASYAITDDKLKNFKQFMNKIWNASKFVLQNIEDMEFNESNLEILEQQLSKEIIEHTKNVKRKITENIENFEFGHATETLYHEFWHTFCDIYIERSKELFASEDKKIREEISMVMIYTLKSYIKMLHPFIPFVTERIWREVPKSDGDHSSIMYSRW